MAILEIKDIHKRFGETQALAGVSFEVNAGEVVAVLGPSGCGKSTLLSVITGLEKLDAGAVVWEGKDLVNVPTHKRGFGLMFQDYALFPHKNVFENVAFGLRMMKLEQTEIKPQVEEALARVGLDGYGKRDVSSLSGGEQQRVAMARALAPRPRLLMLDEPLGSLDRALRERLLDDLRNIIRQSGQTTIYVTHDQEEAFALADRIVVMRAGKAVRIGTPQEIYQTPNSEFVAHFLGLKNIFEGVLQDGTLETPIGSISVEVAGIGMQMVLLRPDQVSLGTKDQQVISGTLKEVTFRGGMLRVGVEVNQQPLSFDFPASIALPEVGEEIQLSFDPAHAIQFLGEWKIKNP